MGFAFTISSLKIKSKTTECPQTPSMSIKMKKKIKEKKKHSFSQTITKVQKSEAQISFN